MAKMTKAQIEDQAIARKDLRRILRPGQTVSTVITHESRSGMARSIKLVTADKGAIRDITWLVALALGDKIDSAHGGIKVPGAGMDMGFHLVYALSRALYPNGHKCIGQKCPSNDHSNDFGAYSRRFESEHGSHENTHESRTAWCVARSKYWEASESERYAKTRVHSDGGYALNHRWL